MYYLKTLILKLLKSENVQHCSEDNANKTLEFEGLTRSNLSQFTEQNN